MRPPCRCCESLLPHFHPQTAHVGHPLGKTWAKKASAAEHFTTDLQHEKYLAAMQFSNLAEAKALLAHVPKDRSTTHRQQLAALFTYERPHLPAAELAWRASCGRG